MKCKEEVIKPCPIRAVAIYGGKDEAWKGWYNFFDSKTGVCIVGPCSPEESKALLYIIDNWNTRSEYIKCQSCGCPLDENCKCFYCNK